MVLNIKHKTARLLENNIRERFQDLELGEALGPENVMTPKS